jgi:hypothetical protein
MRVRKLIPGFDGLSEGGISEAGFPEADEIGRSETRTWEELTEARQTIARRLDSLLDVPPHQNRSGVKTWEELAESRRSLAKRLELLPGCQARDALREAKTSEKLTVPSDPSPAPAIYRATMKSLLKRGASLVGGLMPESGSDMRARNRRERRTRFLIRSTSTWKE